MCVCLDKYVNCSTEHFLYFYFYIYDNAIKESSSECACVYIHSYIWYTPTPHHRHVLFCFAAILLLFCCFVYLSLFDYFPPSFIYEHAVVKTVCTTSLTSITTDASASAACFLTALESAAVAATHPYEYLAGSEKERVEITIKRETKMERRRKERERERESAMRKERDRDGRVVGKGKSINMRGEGEIYIEKRKARILYIKQTE